MTPQDCEKRVRQIQSLKERLHKLTVELEEISVDNLLQHEVAALGVAESHLHLADLALAEFT